MKKSSEQNEIIMRKICCVCLAFFLCLMVCGCQNDSSKNTPTPTLRTPSDGYELVIPGEFDDYVYGEGVSLIEWANLIEEILPEKRIAITIEKDLEQGFDYRRITIEEEA